MDEYAIGVTPFGRRSLTVARAANQVIAKARLPEKAVHRWHDSRAICMAKARVGVSQFVLAAADASLSFQPETSLSGDGLIVFPSNQQLALRPHGMAPATSRRHLVALIEGSLIIRLGSPRSVSAQSAEQGPSDWSDIQIRAPKRARMFAPIAPTLRFARVREEDARTRRPH